MKLLYLTLSALITIFLYFLIILISVNYPIDFIHKNLLKNNDPVVLIETLDTLAIIFSFLLIVVLYFLCFKIYIRKTFKPQLIIISNLILLIVGIIYYLYWNTDLFYTQIENSDSFYNGLSTESYVNLKMFSFISILSSIFLNLLFLSNLISTKKKLTYILFVFIPILSLFFLKYYTFFNSKFVVWVKKGDKDFKYYNVDFLNLNIEDDTLIWHKGLENWITFKEFKINTNLGIIK